MKSQGRNDREDVGEGWYDQDTLKTCMKFSKSKQKLKKILESKS